MTPTSTLYLTAQQVETIRNLDVFDGAHSVTIHQADLMRADRDIQGWIMVEESMGQPGVQIDRQGNVVENAR